MLIEVNPLKFSVSRKIFKDKHSYTSKLDPSMLSSNIQEKKFQEFKKSGISNNNNYELKFQSDKNSLQGDFIVKRSINNHQDDLLYLNSQSQVKNQVESMNPSHLNKEMKINSNLSERKTELNLNNLSNLSHINSKIELADYKMSNNNHKNITNTNTNSNNNNNSILKEE